jgi:protein Mpv17
MQKRSPLLTQLESSLVIYFLGDLSAQYVSNRGNPDASYEADRGLKALLIGGLSSIPSYKWFMFLGTHFNYASHTLSLAVKIVINQSVFTPLFNTYFFGMQALLSGATFAQAKQRVIDTVPRSWKNSWKVWPIVTAFSFTYIPPQYRNIFAGVIAIGWQTYLSWLNKSAEALESGKAGKIEPLHEEEHTKFQDAKAAEKA